MKNRLRTLHLFSAMLIGLFLLMHLTNHIAGLAGQAKHIETMSALRTVYRNPLFEYPLLALIVWQVGSGLTMVIRGWKERSGVVGWAQALSGAYLGFFLLNHVGSVLGGRIVFGLDTDFRFAAAGFHVPGWPLFFAPYYFLGVFSLFVHVACAAYWNLPENGSARQAVPKLLAGTGALLGLSFVMMMAGALNPVDIPDAYRATYGVTQ